MGASRPSGVDHFSWMHVAYDPKALRGVLRSCVPHIPLLRPVESRSACGFTWPEGDQLGPFSSDSPLCEAWVSSTALTIAAPSCRVNNGHYILLSSEAVSGLPVRVPGNVQTRVTLDTHCSGIDQGAFSIIYTVLHTNSVRRPIRRNPGTARMHGHSSLRGHPSRHRRRPGRCRVWVEAFPLYGLHLCVGAPLCTYFKVQTIGAASLLPSPGRGLASPQGIRCAA